MNKVINEDVLRRNAAVIAETISKSVKVETKMPVDNLQKLIFYISSLKENAPFHVFLKHHRYFRNDKTWRYDLKQKRKCDKVAPTDNMIDARGGCTELIIEFPNKEQVIAEAWCHEDDVYDKRVGRLGAYNRLRRSL